MDLTKAARLVLHGGEDAALLSQLPALRRLALPSLRPRPPYYAWARSLEDEARLVAAAEALRLALPGVEVAGVSD